MFKKIVSQLSFSPALVGQLGFYAKRLRKEQATRRLGLIFVALALVVQSLVVFQAPEPANAANPSDMVPGGLGFGSNRDFNKFLTPYDRNDYMLKDIFNHFGITRSEITSSQYGSFIVKEKIGWGHENRAGAKAVTITNDAYQPVGTLYGRSLKLIHGSETRVWGWIGHSSKLGWFGIMAGCGNLVTDIYPPERTPPPAPANIVASKTAINSTQNIDATKTAAKAGDVVTYTVNAKNTGGTAKTVDFSDNLTDVLGFSTLTNNGGGTFNNTSKILSWPSMNLGPGANVTKTYAVKMNSSLVTTKTDCKMSNNFIDQVVTVPVGCTTPPAKVEVSKKATNISQGNVEASTVIAQESDRITFVLSAKNTGGTPKDFVFEDNIGDALEYAKVVDNGGGTYDEKTRILSWPSISLKPGEEQVRAFTMQILSTMPATSQGVSDRSSYDCRIENAFYEEYVIFSVNCPTPKVIEQVVPELPQTGPGENMLFAGVVLSIVTFFYLRSRQLGTEVRLIRRDINGGTI